MAFSNSGKNASGNLSSGGWPMPEPAYDGSADVAVNMPNLIKVAASGHAADDGNRMSDSLPKAGGNDGNEPDGLPKNDAQRG